MVASLVALTLISRQLQTPPVLKLNQPIEREIRVKDVHTFYLELKEGEFVHVSVMQKGVDVVVRAYDPSGAKIAEIDSPNGAEGEEPCEFEAAVAGKYKLEVAPLPEDTAGGNYSITLTRDLSKEEFAGEKARAAAALEADRVRINDWLKGKAVPIDTVEAGHGFADLDKLKGTLKDVQIVGLGEATHGTREFFQMKHRMLEFLAKEMGFTVFGIEATYAECLAINNYVLRGEGDPELALRGQYFWTWDTEEVLDMIKWMRAYNQTVPEDKKLKFLGFDVQAAKQAGRKVVSFLEKVDPQRVESVRADMDPVYPWTMEKQQGYAKLSAEEHAKHKAALEKLVESFEVQKEAYVAKSSQTDFNEALDSAWELVHYQAMVSVSDVDSGAIRDAAMADMVERLLSQEKPGTKMVLWAHNAHIQNKEPWMGSHLAKRFGPKYYCIGFAFDEGSFQAINSDPKVPPGPGLQEFVASPGGPASLGWFLRQPGYDKLFVDFRSLKPGDPVTAWWHTPHPIRQWGALSYQPALSLEGTPVAVDVYDGLIFVRKTTRARPNAAWRQPYDPKLERPSPMGP